MKKIHILMLILVLLFSIINISILNISPKDINAESINIVEKKVTYKDKFNKEEKYFNKLNYKTFAKLFKEKEVYTIAITNNNSKTKDSFIKLINTLSFYNNENIYLINISNLSKKNKAKYYNLNSELKELKENYIIKTYNKKIISKTIIDDKYINIIINSYE